MTFPHVVHKTFKVIYLLYTIFFVVMNVFMMELRKFIHHFHVYVIDLAGKDVEIDCDEKLTLEDAFLYSDYLLDELNNRMKEDFSSEWKMKNKDIIKMVFENHCGIALDEDAQARLDKELEDQKKGAYEM